MFARSLRAGCTRVSRRSVQTSSLAQKTSRRRYSNASPAPVSSTQSPVAALGGLTSELDRLSPRFDINASQITILQDPSEFYETLKASHSSCLILRYSLLSTLYHYMPEVQCSRSSMAILRLGQNAFSLPCWYHLWAYLASCQRKSRR